MRLPVASSVTPASGWAARARSTLSLIPELFAQRKGMAKKVLAAVKGWQASCRWLRSPRLERQGCPGQRLIFAGGR